MHCYEIESTQDLGFLFSGPFGYLGISWEKKALLLSAEGECLKSLSHPCPIASIVMIWIDWSDWISNLSGEPCQLHGSHCWGRWVWNPISKFSILVHYPPFQQVQSRPTPLPAHLSLKRSEFSISFAGPSRNKFILGWRMDTWPSESDWKLTCQSS